MSVKVHVSETGVEYPLPKGVSKYKYGYVIRNKTWGVKYFRRTQYLNLDHAFQAAVNQLGYLISKHSIPVGMATIERINKTIKTGMQGVHVTTYKNSEIVRITVTLFNPAGKYITKTVGRAVIDSTNYRTTLDLAKRIRTSNVLDEVDRQLSLLPKVIDRVLDKSGLIEQLPSNEL